MVDKITGFKHEALELLYHLCVQTYETEVRMGQETTRLVNTYTKPLKPGTGSFLDMQCPPLLDGTTLGCTLRPDRADEVIELEGPPGANGTFSANYGGLEAMSSLIKTALAGYAKVYYDPVVYTTPDVAYQGKEFVQSLFQDVVFSLDVTMDRSRLPSRVRNIYDNAAIAISST